MPYIADAEWKGTFLASAALQACSLSAGYRSYIATADDIALIKHEIPFF